jgi:tetratricopeptide (TPR) repeat protein
VIIVAAWLAATAAMAQPASDCAEFGDYDKALAACAARIRRNPADATAYYVRGQQYSTMATATELSKGKGAPAARALYDKAFADLSKAIEINPNYVEAYWGRSTVRKMRGDGFQAQIDDCDLAVRAAPNNPDVYSVRAVAYVFEAKERRSAELWDLAIADYTKALSFKPRDADLMVNRGTVYADRGDCAAALKDYTAGIEIDLANHPVTPKKSLWFWSVRGDCYAQLGDKVRAVADYNKVLKADPDDWMTRDALKKLGTPAR